MPGEKIKRVGKSKGIRQRTKRGDSDDSDSEHGGKPSSPPKNSTKENVEDDTEDARENKRVRAARVERDTLGIARESSLLMFLWRR